MANAASADLTIPVADILGHRKLELSYGVAGTERRIDKGYSHGWNAQVGLLGRLELGIDNDFFGDSSFNANFLLYQEPTLGK